MQLDVVELGAGQGAGFVPDGSSHGGGAEVMHQRRAPQLRHRIR